jgi:hypothetical protein
MSFLSMHHGHLLRRVAVVSAVALPIGCADPQGAYDDFGKRFTHIHQGTSAASSGGSGGAACVPMDGSSDGEYYLLLSSTLAPTAPVAFKLDITSSPGSAGGLKLNIKGEALDHSDRRTPVGGQVKPDIATADADGTTDVEFKSIVIDGRADTLIAGAEIDATDVVLAGGSFCAPKLMCGTVTGMATKPTALDLKGSTWAMQPIVGGMFPADDYYDCEKDIAAAPK